MYYYLSQQNLNPNFIGSWIINPISICDDLISYFESNKDKQQKGKISGGENLDVKNSIDIGILPKDLELPCNAVFKAYFNSLFSCYRDYTTQWPFLTQIVKNVQIGIFNLQRYQSGQHFQSTHTERSSLDNLHRIFAWMTYLNDVENDSNGWTYLTLYNLKIPLRIGFKFLEISSLSTPWSKHSSKCSDI